MSPDEIEQWDWFTARFEPCGSEPTKPSLLPHVGRVFEFRALWMIEHEDDKAHPGHWACSPATTMDDFPAPWIASADLARVE